MSDLDAIFKAYDVRGIVPDQLNADLAERIGAAFGRFAAHPASDEEPTARRLIVGRDMRSSGRELAAAFGVGVTGQGLDLVDVGLASTDLIYFASGKLDAPAAMFTASHNPAQYNGIKLCLSGARPVGQDTGLAEVRRLTETGVSASGWRGHTHRVDMLDEFAEHVRSFVDVETLRPLRVVADTANGMGGLVVPKVFETLPFDLELLYPELDGSFPNHPADPIQPENLRDLRDRVRETGADVGLAFDGDADRVFLVDETAQPLSGSTTTAIVAKGFLEREPGATILHNLICSKAVPEVIRENGGIPVRTRVGHSFIKQVMAERDAVFGGEHSAHYYFRDNWRADSGSIAALVVLEQLSKSGVPLSELRKPFERYASSGEVNFEVSHPPAVIERVAAAYPAAQQDRLDGLTVDAGDWWVNLRPSNTEPLLRLNLEARTSERRDEKLAELHDLITNA